VRKTAGIVLAASAVLLALSACAPSGPGVINTPEGPCRPVWQHGGLANDIAAAGDPDAELTVTFPTPLVSQAQTYAAIVTGGPGRVVQPDDLVTGHITVVDAESGETMASAVPADQNGQPLYYAASDAEHPLFAAAACATVGSRVVAVGKASDIIGAGLVSSWGIDADATLVAALDVDAAYPSRANGSPVPPQNGLPTVSYAADGRPGLSFTNAKPPTELRIEPLIAGGGEVVEDGDTLLVNYTGVDWATREVFDSSWEKGLPATISTDQVVPGFAKAVIGQRVGSQVLVAIPPSEGYGDNPPSGLTKDSTMVFVIDILGIVPAAQ